MQVGPTCHYIMGGVEVDADTGAAAVPGLFAAGEVSGGMHGSNRLGGNSLSDLLVFGRRAGAGAASYVNALAGRPKISDEAVTDAKAEALAPLQRSGENPYEVHHELQRTMNELVGIIRKEEEVSEALESVEKLKERAQRGRRGRQPDLQPRLAPRARPAQHAPRLRVRGQGGRCSVRRAVAVTPATTSRACHPSGAPRSCSASSPRTARR